MRCYRYDHFRDRGYDAGLQEENSGYESFGQQGYGYGAAYNNYPVPGQGQAPMFIPMGQASAMTPPLQQVPNNMMHMQQMQQQQQQQQQYYPGQGYAGAMGMGMGMGMGQGYGMAQQGYAASAMPPPLYSMQPSVAAGNGPLGYAAAGGSNSNGGSNNNRFVSPMRQGGYASSAGVAAGPGPMSQAQAQGRAMPAGHERFRSPGRAAVPESNAAQRSASANNNYSYGGSYASAYGAQPAAAAGRGYAAAAAPPPPPMIMGANLGSAGGIGSSAMDMYSQQAMYARQQQALAQQMQAEYDAQFAGLSGNSRSGSPGGMDNIPHSKPRPVDFQPYDLKDYAEKEYNIKKGGKAGYWELGRLGPDLETEELQAKVSAKPGLDCCRV